MDAIARKSRALFTTGNRFIAGPVAGADGMFVMSGCRKAGVTHGPALGRILTEYALDGKTKWDTTKFQLVNAAS